MLAMVSHAPVTSWLDYCNVPCVRLLLKMTPKSQTVQSAVTHLLPNKPRWVPSCSILTAGTELATMGPFWLQCQAQTFAIVVAMIKVELHATKITQGPAKLKSQ